MLRLCYTYIPKNVLLLLAVLVSHGTSALTPSHRPRLIHCIVSGACICQLANLETPCGLPCCLPQQNPCCSAGAETRCMVQPHTPETSGLAHTEAPLKWGFQTSTVAHTRSTRTDPHVSQLMCVFHKPGPQHAGRPSFPPACVARSASTN